jgi:hypothetical protein
MEMIPATSEKKYTFEGYFNLKETFDHLQRYLEESKYYWDVTLKEHTEKSGKGTRDIDSKFEAEKVYNDQFKIKLKYQVQMSGKEEEVKLNNRLVKLTKGKAKITLNAYVERDWHKRRSKNALHKFLGEVYDKFVGHDEERKVMMEAGKDVSDLLTRFKEHMNSQI